MRESGEPMEFGILDFYEVFSRAFGVGGNGAAGLEWKVGDVALSAPPRFEKRGILVVNHFAALITPPPTSC